MYSKYFYRDSTVTSQEKDSNGNPLLTYKNKRIEVRSMEHVANFLQAAKEKRLNETKLCLEGSNEMFTIIFNFFKIAVNDISLITHTHSRNLFLVQF